MSAPIPHYLALDQGGHSSRALLFDATGTLVARAQTPVTTQYIDAARVEQDADEVVRSLRDVIADIARQTDTSALSAIGLATQRSSIVCWSRNDGRALTPILSWQDRRNAAMIDAMSPYADAIHARTGLFLSPHYGASKLRWCLDHFPEVRRAAADNTLAASPLISFLAHHLLRQHPYCVDPANAGRTLLWNLQQRTWDTQIAQWFGVPVSVLPTVTPSCDAFGEINVGGTHYPLRVLQGDQPAALFADGWPRVENIYINIGTGAFIQRPFTQLPPDLPRHLRSLVLQGLGRTIYTAEATVNGAASAVDLLFAQHQRSVDHTLLAHCLVPGDAPPLYLNGVGGLAAPWWLPHFSSRFIDATPDFAAQLAGILESVVFLLATNIETLATLAPAPTQIVLSGGWSHIDELARRLAVITNLQVTCQHQAEATARGVAFLAGAAPRHWQPSGTRASFAPAEDVTVSARYRAWRDAMRAHTQLGF